MYALKRMAAYVIDYAIVLLPTLFVVRHAESIVDPENWTTG